MDQTTNYMNKRACILGFPVDLTDMDCAIKYADECIKNSVGGHVVTLNPEMIMQGRKNTELKTALKCAELIIPDGIGVIKALRKLGINDVQQLPGIEFSEKLIEFCAQNRYSVAFIGASKDVLDLMMSNVKSKYNELNIVYSHDGFFDQSQEQEIINNLLQTKPNVVFLALGVPKQELWIYKNKSILNNSLMVGVGGSFDVWAGKVKRAPFVFRKFGLEWFYRLISQPSRFTRMFPTLPLFFIKVALDNKNTRKEY